MVGPTTSFIDAVASSCRVRPSAIAGNSQITLHINCKIMETEPLEGPKGLDSAKSHVIGRACLRKVLTTSSFFGDELQVQMVEEVSASLSTANAKYVATESA